MSRIGRHPFLSAIALVLLASLIVVGASGLVVWRAAHHDDASDVETVDAIAVLGAAQYDGVPSPVFRGRLDHAALLFQQGRAGRVYVLGADQPGDRSTEADSGRGYLIRQGVPASSVVAIPLGHTTYESLQALARALRADGLDSVFLVSDPWHNARIKRMAGQETRVPGYLRETFAYLYYRVVGR